MGLLREDADRQERASGRSLTVLRRRLAKNSALKTPEWAQGENLRAMIVAALAGGWRASTRQTADQKIVADMWRGQYDDFECEVIRFMGMNDAPIEKIGDIWQVKSRLDALLAVAKDIAQGDLKRFFCAAKNVFLAEHEVSAYASMFSRPAHSDCLRRGLAESLILLSVYAKSFSAIGNVGDKSTILSATFWRIRKTGSRLPILCRNSRRPRRKFFWMRSSPLWRKATRLSKRCSIAAFTRICFGHSKNWRGRKMAFSSESFSRWRGYRIWKTQIFFRIHCTRPCWRFSARGFLSARLPSMSGIGCCVDWLMNIRRARKNWRLRCFALSTLCLLSARSGSTPPANSK